MYYTGMSILFEPFKIGVLDVRNRFMRSATTSGWSDERGIIRPEIIELYNKLSEGGIGLIVKGHLYVTDSGKAHEGMAGINSDYHIPKLKELTNIIHKNGSKIIAQLNHGGIYSIVDKAGPSAYKDESFNARALTLDEIYDIVNSFGNAADRAMSAGFDGIQIHGAHGYLISQFLSKLVNKRTDEWGGSLENRMRLLFEIYDEIRKRVGICTPVFLKLNCDDFSPNGFTIEESMQVSEVIYRRGLDCLEVSGGGVGSQKNLEARAKSLDPELYEASFAGYAKKIRGVTQQKPMALVNGIRSRDCMEAIIRNSLADLISMSRPFIREPDLIKRLERGQQTATCNSCGVCNSEEVLGKMMLQCHLK